MTGLTVRELQDILKDCDPDTDIEFLFYNSLNEMPGKPKFILQYCYFAYYKTNRNPPLLNLAFREHPVRKLPKPDKQRIEVLE